MKRARLPRSARVEQPDARGDAGFTIIELLIVIVLEALIMAALGSAFTLVVNNTSSVNQSAVRSTDARDGATYFMSDARNSSGPELSLSDTTSCPDASPPVAGTATAVVRFNWNSTSSATGTTTPNIANYVLVSNSLLRRYCKNGALVTDNAIATNVSSVTIACSPTANCSGTPTTITATITETQGSSGGAAYQYSLTGAFRKALETGAPPVNPVSLVALGGTCAAASDAIGLAGSSSVGVQVYGDAYVNTADVSTCTGLSLTKASTFQAGSTKILTGGTCAASGGSVCPTITSYSPAIADPYAGVTAPTTTGRPSQAGCPSNAAQPGVYAAVLTISAACTLASGVYILQAGLSVTGAGSITTASGGVLLYITGGTFSIAGSTSHVTVAAATSGTWSGIAVWQAAADTTALAFSQAATGSFAATGAVYAPGAGLTTSGGAAPSMATLVVKTITMPAGTLTVGTPSSTPLSITGPASLPAWTVGQPYPATTVSGSGGFGVYTWSAAGLPAGLTINANTGVISGTPTAAGAPSATITLNDMLGDTPATQAYTVTINAAPTITTVSPLAAGEVTVAYSAALAKSGGTAAYTWSATGLPAGLSINSGTGVISGTPTAGGTTTAAVTLTDGTGATTSKNLSITISAGPTITSVTLQNNNGAAGVGKIEKGDKIIIVFSATMSVSSFCSTWSNDATNQTLNVDNDVSVNVSNGTGATNDAVTVTSGVCTTSFHFGSIDLGSNAFVSAAATFTGAAANKSTIAWTAGTHTLTILLGTMTTGTVAAVASSTPIYTASGSLIDPQNIVIANSPFTLTAGAQF